MCSLVESRGRRGQRSKRLVSPSCHRRSKHEERRISHGTLLVDFRGRKRRHTCSVFRYVDDFILACSDSPFGKHVFDSTKHFMNGEFGSHECSYSATHESHKQTTNTPEHGADWGQFRRMRERNFGHHLAITSTPRQKIPNHSTLAVSTSTLERSVALVGYAMFATVADASVTVDGTKHRKPQWTRFMR